MKTFLKVLLIVIAALVALKLLPFAVALGCAAVFLTLIIAGLGLSAAAVMLVVAMVAATVLSPIWVPVLAVVGIVALVRRANRATS